MRKTAANTPMVDMRLIEEACYQRGFRFLAGVDEVGRGPLAGPVVAAAVILPREAMLPGVKDSKLLSPAQREACCERILESALAFGVGSVDASEIDCINIAQATFRAMVQAIENLSVPPDHVLIDGPYRLPIDISQEGIPQGDRCSLSIAAASIVAKVHRDRLMEAFHSLYPDYGFDSNKGYGTPRHMEALRSCGPCPIHRKSFSGVKPE